MNGLSPLAALYDVEHGSDVPLPPALAALYGRLQFPLHARRPYYVMGNFVSTLDGVVTLNMPGQSGGGPISGFNPHDRLVMGLLRAVADAVIVGAGTLRAVPEHRWTAAYVAPAYAEAYQELRTRLGKPDPPLNVIVTARGVISLDLPVFQSGEVPVLLVTTTQGEERIRTQRVPPSVQIAAVQHAGVLSAQAIVQAVCRVRPCQIILVEGGPQLLGNFLAEQLLDELFLTLAPQIAGRDTTTSRPGLVEGYLFAPEHPLWGTLVSVKCGGSHLFLRYAFKARERI
jgi:riboflavin biosynthesis pyrimidine reductase